MATYICKQSDNLKKKNLLEQQDPLASLKMKLMDVSLYHTLPSKCNLFQVIP